MDQGIFLFNHSCYFGSFSTFIKLDAKVEQAYESATRQSVTRQVPLEKIGMATAAENDMSSHQRKSIMTAFSHLPLYLQHNTISKLHIIEGSLLKSVGTYADVLQSFESAAAIDVATRRNSAFSYFEDLWHFVGASLACKNIERAYESLSKFWNAQAFKVMSSDAANSAFTDLSLKYTMP